MRTKIFDIDNWREIGSTLAKNKTRTFLTAFGIFWGTAMLAMLWGGSKGLEDIIRRNFDGFATNTAIIQSGRRTVSYKGFNKGSTWTLTQTDLDNINRLVPEVDTAVPLIMPGQRTIVNGDKSTTADLKGEAANYIKIFLPIIYEGRYINESDDSQERKVCVLGKKVAGEIFGRSSPIGQYVAIDGIYYKVIGVAGQNNDVNIGRKTDESVIIPSTTLRRAFNLGDKVDGAMLLFNDGCSPSDALPKIERIIQRNHPISPDDHNALFFFDISAEFKMLDNLFTGISLLALFVGVGSLMAGIIGVGNIMWVIVKERTQEIGIRRAIGARPSDIISQILSEGVLLTLVAGLAGICFAVGILYVAQNVTANETMTPRFQLSFVHAVTIVAIFVGLGTAAGLIPARKAMKIKPVEAMRASN